MRICVYGASSNTIDKKYISATEDFGRKLAKRGHGVVCGGGANGLMGAVQRGAKEVGGEIIGVVPTFFNEMDVNIFKDGTELIWTDSMRHRKQVMEDKADAFVVTPGGIGTFEEFFEILTLKQLERHEKPIVVFNMYGYYDTMKEMMEQAIAQNFMKDACRELYFFADTAEEVLDYLEAYKPAKAKTKHYKAL